MNATTTYNELRPLLATIVHRFRTCYGGDAEELRAEANYHFAEALQSFNPTMGTLRKHVGWRVWYGMFETMRTRCRRKAITDRENVEPDTLPARRRSWLDTVLRELSEDARLVVGAALETGSRNSLVRLLEEWGWCGRRIVETFREIREAL